MRLTYFHTKRDFLPWPNALPASTNKTFAQTKYLYSYLCNRKGKFLFRSINTNTHSQFSINTFLVQSIEWLHNDVHKERKLGHFQQHTTTCYNNLCSGIFLDKDEVSTLKLRVP